MQVFKNENLTIDYQPQLSMIKYEWVEEEEIKKEESTSTRNVFEKYIPIEFLIPKDRFYKYNFSRNETWVDNKLFFNFTKIGDACNIIIVCTDIFSRIDIKPTEDDHTAQNFINQYFENLQNTREWLYN